MDRRYNRTLPIDEQQQLHQQQVVQYEEVLAEDDGSGGGQYMDPNEMADQGMYYEEYADVDPINPNNAIVSGHGQAAYYEQVIEERPMALRPGMGVDARGPYLVGQRPLLNPYPPSNHRFVQQQQQRYVHSPSLLSHIRPYHQQQHQQPAVTRYVPPPARFVQQQPQQQQYPRTSTSTSSLVYTPPTSLAMGPRREAGGSSTGPRPLQPYTPNFSSLFPSRTPKPAKIRKMASKKKPCNCTKSMCLKLYCDCFANGEFCLDCNCKDCHNNLEHEAERSRAIKSSLERNPTAFKPKIGVAAKAAAGKVAAAAPVDMERLHQRGCHCKKSNCLKNYCECFEAKVPCTERCKCQGCRNTEHDRHHKKFRDKFTTAGGLAQLAAAAAADNNRARSGSASDFGEGSDGAGGDREEGRAHGQLNPRTQPWHYMSEDVIEATTMCLVSQAKEFESTLPEEELEKSVLREFGRCLEQIIESANSCVLGASHA